MGGGEVGDVGEGVDRAGVGGAGGGGDEEGAVVVGEGVRSAAGSRTPVGAGRTTGSGRPRSQAARCDAVVGVGARRGCVWTGPWRSRARRRASWLASVPPVVTRASGVGGRGGRSRRRVRGGEGGFEGGGGGGLVPGVHGGVEGDGGEVGGGGEGEGRAVEVGGAVGVGGVGGAFGEGGDEGAQGVVGAGAVVGDEGCRWRARSFAVTVSGPPAGRGPLRRVAPSWSAVEDGVEEGAQVGGACGASGEGRGGHGWCGPSGARGRWCQLVRIAEGAAEEPNDLEPERGTAVGAGVLGPAAGWYRRSLFVWPVPRLLTVRGAGHGGWRCRRARGRAGACAVSGRCVRRGRGAGRRVGR